MLSIQELHIGQHFVCDGPRMTLQAFCDFGALLGTDAPIHCDPTYAAGTPFVDVIAQGPLLLAPFEGWMCELFGEEAWSRSGQIEIKFLVPGKVGSHVGLEMTVRDVAGDTVSFDVHARCGETLLAIAATQISLPPSR